MSKVTPNASGRTREKVEGMRKVFFALGRQKNGVAVDTQDFERTDPWHRTADAKNEVGRSMTRLWLERFRPEPANTEEISEGK